MKVYSKLSTIPNVRATETVTPGCLVLEGGAFRGMYTQGVLDFWMQNDLNIHTVIGVSAGALTGMNYVSGQIGRSARTYLGYRHKPSFIGLPAFLRSRSLIRLDFILNDYDKIEKLDESMLYSPERRFVVLATSCETGEPMYFEKANCKDMKSAIKASSSMPFITPMVSVDGHKCLDGGCSCAVPYQWAIDQGYEKIVVVTTHDKAFRNIDPKVMKTGRRFYPRHKAFSTVLDQSHVRYNKQYNDLERLASEKRIFWLAPSEKVTLKRLDGDMEKLGDLYWLGYHDAEKSFTDLKEYQNV